MPKAAGYWVVCLGHASAFPCKKQYKVHFGATYLVICVGPASTLPCKKQYKVHFGATSWVICVGHASTFPCKKTIQSTLRNNIFGHFCLPCEHFPLQQNNTTYTSGQHVGSYVWATRTLSLAKKPYKVHFGATYLDICVVPASTFPCKEQYKVHFGATYWVIFVGPASTLYCFLQGKVLAGPTNMTKYVAARGARGASGAPGVPGTLGPQRRAHGVGFGSQ